MMLSHIFPILFLGAAQIEAQHVPSCELHETHDVCQDPIHVGTYFTSPQSTQQCAETQALLFETRSITRTIIRYIRPILDDFIHAHNISADEGTNRNIISLFEHPTHDDLSQENLVTRIYMKFTGLVQTHKLLKCQLTETMNRCQCLKLPDHIFHRIKSRLLGKWYTIQDKCGQLIENRQCDVTFQLPFNQPITCETLRDVIFNLLHHALNVLQESETAFPRLRQLISN